MVHLAHFNIARLRAPLDHPSMRGFAEGLAPINRLADESPGFVWRLQDQGGDSMATRPYEDERIAITLSVWESVEALHHFVYRSHHVDYLRERAKWFLPMKGYALVLWWIAEGTVPHVEEAKTRLQTLREHGPSPYAFTFRKSFPASEEAVRPAGAGK